MRADRDKAVRTLLNTYWSASGWTLRPPDPAAFEQARRLGVMFDTAIVESQHDDLVTEAVAVARRVTPKRVGDAFVASLSTRQVELRSALASFALLEHLRPHELSGKPCGVCGLSGLSKLDLNVFSFERFKWGGVRHGSVEYAVHDLRWFLEEDTPAPNLQDRECLNQLLELCRSALAGTTPPQLAQSFAGVVRSSKDERRILVDVLGVGGVLRPGARLGFDQAFVPVASRECPAARFMETAYPACWWRGGDGLNEPVLTRYFGDHVA